MTKELDIPNHQGNVNQNLMQAPPHAHEDIATTKQPEISIGFRYGEKGLLAHHC